MENKGIATSYCIYVPEDATNGDVIKLVFPDAKIRNRSLGGGFIKLGKEVWINEDLMIYIPDTFWDAPYETETWNGIHAQVTAPKGTFKKIFEDSKRWDDDYGEL